MTEEALHPAALSMDRLLQDCRIRRQRRSGPGGQHRNKVETAVVIVHRPTGVKSEASERRSQQQNHRVAVFRLRVNLALEVRCAQVADYAASSQWRSRCRNGRLSLSATHDDFPTLLAEALDVLHASEFDLKGAARTLGVSVSQLTKLLKNEPRALQQVNDRRSQLNLRPLR